LKNLFYVRSKKLILGFVFYFFIILVIPTAFAQSIPITKSEGMNDIVFDGKWTFLKEWKQSSVDTITNEFDDILVYIRTAHQDEFIYVMLDVIADETIDNNKDEAIVCFDAKNNQNIIPDNNDFCFMIKISSDKPITLQGSEKQDGFKIVENNVGLIAVGDASDKNDRYSPIAHATYEFRIPIEILGRDDHYGFYVQVFDSTKSDKYTWPSGMDLESKTDIVPPDKWGVIYSPDKSLPEYEMPILVLILGTFGILFLSLKNKKLNLLYLNR